MHYTAYLRRTEEAAASLGGRYISLAGGFYGVLLATDDADRFLVLALDLEDSLGWAVWSEDAMGERCCDGSTELGWPSIAQLAHVARNAAADHVCQ